MSSETSAHIARTIATDIRPDQVAAAIALLDGGATVPFVARYRKEATGGLDDTQLRNLEDRLGYLRELEARRKTVLDSIREQGKLTEALEAQIATATTKAVLEDLYLPYKPKRRTKAAIAREQGLEPLADAILPDRRTPPETLAAGYVTDEVPDAKEALSGARDILAERLAEDAALIGRLRAFMQKEAFLTARVVEGQEEKGAKFSDYFAHTERWSDVPSHRALAMMRGSSEGVLNLNIAPNPETGRETAERMVDLGAAPRPRLGRWPVAAEAIAARRNEAGAFRKRKDLLSVPRLGPKAFEQCAAFLRIEGRDEPLDASAVHPEATGSRGASGRRAAPT